ncbi:uncharacterized protein LOC123015933 [Tribolium madens]|uniref:uncharacterized protein LOC123015933 n=1 Tax=Tribolium madens TaxID=41895 RepID=UPI001CF73699|nr:uncharacterized protein LOC123015933 [Tribolium madens]
MDLKLDDDLDNDLDIRNSEQDGNENFTTTAMTMDHDLNYDLDNENTATTSAMNKTSVKDYRKSNKSRIHLSRRRIKYKGCIKRKDKKKNSVSKNNRDVEEIFNNSTETLTTNDHEEISHEDSSLNIREELEEGIEEERVTIEANQEYRMEGQRIVAIQDFINSLKLLGDHNKDMACTLSNMIVQKEIRNGLESTLIFKCNMCNKVKSIQTNNTANETSVIGIMNIGSGYSHLEQLTSAMDIPCMSNATYQKIQNRVCDSWEEAALESMIEAGQEEKRLAIENGDVTDNGIPYITVVCDGSWAKRSYRTNYNSLSGAAAIVGYRTRKVLHLGVKNKFCLVCKKNENHDSIPEHKCYKNFTGSSSSMESFIIAEGFQQSLNTHGLIYRFMIADGDSSVFKTLLDLRPYASHSIKIEKIECKNHLLRNYRNKLRDLFQNTNLPIILRRKVKVGTLFVR